MPPVQHAWRKVPIEYQEQIECTLDDMVNKGVIAPVSMPSKMISSLISLQAWWYTTHVLTQRILTRPIVWEHYKAPTLSDISHWHSSATYFSKLDAKDTLLEHTPQWEIFLPDPHLIPIMAGTISYTCHSVWRCPKTSFRCTWTRQQTASLAYLPYMTIYIYIYIYIYI